MPQMAPLSWLFMFIIFSLTLILFNTCNFFNIAPSSPLLKQVDSRSAPSFYWKW